jgi:hypothetical protein
MGSPPEPAVPAYSSLRMHRKHPQVLGIGLNRPESSRRRTASVYRASQRRDDGALPASMAVSIFRTDEEGIHKACNRIKWRPGYFTAGCSIIGKTRCDVYIAYDHLLTRYKTNYDDTWRPYRRRLSRRSCACSKAARGQALSTGRCPRQRSPRAMAN